ncbi:MAG: hypothetical protein H7141_03545 [Burkholderiales bacterium]|nr:hypothetical protein [Bacteroidia bacterium]
MKRLFFLASLVTLACISCKAKKEATKISEAPQVTETKQAPETTIIYRLIVSFISKGAGLDRTKQSALLAYIDSHPKKPAYSSILWGREGENDYCFTLSELQTKAEITSFIENVKKIAGGSDMMQISENVVSQHKGR